MKKEDYSTLIKPSKEAGYLLIKTTFFDYLISKKLQILESLNESNNVKCSSYCLNAGAINLLKTWKAITLASKK